MGWYEDLAGSDIVVMAAGIGVAAGMRSSAAG